MNPMKAVKAPFKFILSWVMQVWYGIYIEDDDSDTKHSQVFFVFCDSVACLPDLHSNSEKKKRFGRSDWHFRRSRGQKVFGCGTGAVTASLLGVTISFQIDALIGSFCSKYFTICLMLIYPALSGCDRSSTSLAPQLTIIKRHFHTSWGWSILPGDYSRLRKEIAMCSNWAMYVLVRFPIFDHSISTGPEEIPCSSFNVGNISRSDLRGLILGWRSSRGVCTQKKGTLMQQQWHRFPKKFTRIVCYLTTGVMNIDQWSCKFHTLAATRKMWIHILDVLLTLRRKAVICFHFHMCSALATPLASGHQSVTKMLCREQALAMKLDER